jgi:serine/threonine protein phosphatase 1
MSKWRPASECTYVIGDIHGYNEPLNLILKRILPLRKNDKIIFLGDYVDRGPDSAGVIDTIISLKEEYGDQIIALMGNHEWLFMASMGKLNNKVYYDDPLQIWFSNGAYNTLWSYVRSKGVSENDMRQMPLDRFNNIIPQKHFDFLTNLPYFYETNDYIFVHAGCDPYENISLQNENDLIWDRSLFNKVLSLIANDKEVDFPKTIVTGHNSRGPVITSKFMMIDCSSSKRIMCLELNSMEAFFAEPGNKRLVKCDVQESNKKDLGINNIKQAVFKRC